MAIYYVPGEAGWNDNGTLGSAAQLRLKLEKSYDAVSNRSTLTITMQGRAPHYGGPFRLMDNALLQLNGSTLFNGSSAPFNYNITFQGDNVWHDLTDEATGQTKSWTATVDHAADGTATAVLSVKARLYFSDSYSMTSAAHRRWMRPGISHWGSAPGRAARLRSYGAARHSRTERR